MAWQEVTVSGQPTQWMEVDYTELEQVTDPAKQRWSKDALEQDYTFDGQTHFRFPGQFGTALLLYNFNIPTIPPTAILQSFRVRFEKFMLGGAFTYNDVVDGVLAMTAPSGAGGATPKPVDRNRANGARWPKGVLQPSSYPVLDGVLPDDRLTNAQINEAGFGFLFLMQTVTGKFEGVQPTLGLSNPVIEVTYLEEV